LPQLAKGAPMGQKKVEEQLCFKATRTTPAEEATISKIWPEEEEILSLQQSLARRSL